MSVLDRIEETLQAVLGGVKASSKPPVTDFDGPPYPKSGSTHPGDLGPYRSLEHQEALIGAAMKGFVPKDFRGTPEQFRQALASAYLQNYADNYSGSDNRSVQRSKAEDANQGHVGPSLEWARQQMGLKPYP